ncbi:dipeptidase [Pontibacter sp. G13]|uniref:dipeptidase n=1 Tax=Pontibacter sp. G13 TaxID=3074898 RepID=UPI002889C53D|nr:dipeptidase [Pontibacter sp. G13]WNJ18837.1 dipeptidase [Pontibacter sp. G13]
MEAIKSYIEQNQEKFLNELFDFLKIPSVSADSAYQADVQKAADWLVSRFGELNMDRVEVYPTEGHPIVYAEKIIDDNRPTILVYGHYDVQPPDPIELWDSPPFEPVVKDGKIYARGACDDKGQAYMHLKAIEVLNQGGELPCNVKFIVEGEEEIGSDHLEEFVRKYKDMLSADIILVSDTSMIANDVPSITVGLRGLSYVEVEVTGPNRDLHSGVYGGAIDNPINILCEMIASLKDPETGKITVEGFYDKVEELSAEYREEMGRRPFDRAAYLADLDMADTGGEKGYSELERASIRPTLDVNGIWGGYIGEGAKTVLPSKAFAKISMRLVPHQVSDEITDLFVKHFQKIAPSSVKVEVRPHHGGEAAVVSTETPGYKAAAKAMETSFGKTPIPTREGGSIPIVALFQEVLGLDTVLMGFGLDSDAIHSPNEHYGVFNYLKGIETIPLFHKNFAELAK